MVRIRHVVVLGLALALVAACSKDEKKTGNAPGDKTAEKGAPSGSTVAVDDLTLLPLDSELVLGINFAQVQQSSLWKQFVEPKIMSGDSQAKLAEFKAKCNIDPMTSFKTVSVGLKGLGGAKPDGAIVIHGIDKVKALACIDNNKAELTKDGGEVTRDGDLVMGKNKSGEQFAMMFVSDNTALITIGEKANADGVKEAAQGKSPLKTSPQFVDMYSKVKTSDSLWFLLNGNSKVFEKVAAMGIKPKAVFGSINVTDGLSLDMRMRMETPDAALQLANMGKAQLQQAAKMFDQVDVNADGSDVKFTIVLSNQKLQSLITSLGGMLGGLGGMGK
jgi:hypothetical protein